MKIINVVLLGCFVWSFGAEPVQAQLLRKLKDRATEKVIERVDQKIDQKLQEIAYKQVDKTWDSVFGAPNPEVNGNENYQIPSASNEDYDEEYDNETPTYTLPFSLNSNVKTEE